MSANNPATYLVSGACCSTEEAVLRKALDTADAVLMSGSLGHPPYVFGLSRSTIRIVRQNIAPAVCVKMVMCALAPAGSATLWTAILADDGAALAVMLNALRVLAYRDSA
jgi:Cd2+/Zn2+-exporting ATPase